MSAICPGGSAPLSHLPRDCGGDVALGGGDGGGTPEVKVMARVSGIRKKSARRPVKMYTVTR